MLQFSLLHVLSILLTLYVSSVSSDVVSVSSGSDLGCDFPKIDGRFVTSDVFHDHFMIPKRPAVFLNSMNYSDGTPWKGFEEWKFSNLRNSLNGIKLRVGPGPYPETEMTIAEYLQLAHKITSEKGKMEVPNVFQYGQVPTSWSIWAHKYPCIPVVAYLHPNSRPLHDNVSFVCENILAKIRIPHFLTDATYDDVWTEKDLNESPPPASISHSGLLIGYEESGIDFHKHQDAINLLFHGEKTWFMKVPLDVIESYKLVENVENNVGGDLICDKIVKGDLKLTPEKRYIYDLCYNDINRGQQSGLLAKKLNTAQVTEKEANNTRVLICVQQPGEIIYIPDHYQHGIFNSKPSVAMQMQWYHGDWKNQRVRDYLKQHLMHTLDPNIPSPDDDNDETSSNQAEADNIASNKDAHSEL